MEVGAAGGAKKSAVSEIPSKEFNPERCSSELPLVFPAGQDHIGCLQGGPGGNYLMFGLADGHGAIVGGKVYANKSLEVGLPIFMGQADKIVELYLAGRKSELQTLATELFETLDTELQTYASMGGGSTMTVNFLFSDENDDLHSMVLNIGDSPVMVVTSDGVVEQTMSLNCDTTASVQCYLDELNKMEKMSGKVLVPRDIYLGRLNLSSRNSHQVPCMGQSGIGQDGKELAAIKPFTYTRDSNGKWIVKVDNDTMRKLYDNCHPVMRAHFDNGGPQTIRDRASFLEQLRKWKDVEYGVDFPTWNFGSTVEGAVQCLFSTGDHKSRQEVHPVVCYTNGRKVFDGETTLIGSDGFFDVMTDSSIITGISSAKGGTIGDVTKSLVNTMFEVARNDHSFKDLFTPSGFQRWDDITLITYRTKKVSAPVVEPSHVGCPITRSDDIQNLHWCTHLDCLLDVEGFATLTEQQQHYNDAHPRTVRKTNTRGSHARQNAKFRKKRASSQRRRAIGK